MAVAEEDFEDRVADVLTEVFRRYCPLRFLIDHSADALQDHFRIGTAEHVASAVERLRPFSGVADGDVGDSENAAFLLHRAAVAEHAKSVSFQRDEIEKAEGREIANLTVLRAEA